MVEVAHLLEQVQRIAVAIGMGFKKRFILSRIAAQDQHIVDAQEIQVDQGIFRFPFGETSADKMGHRIDLVVVHDSSANADRAGTLAYFHLFKRTIQFFLEHALAAVIGNVDKRGLELHQGVQVVVNSIDTLAFQRGQDLK